jgi:hypothetical protein
MSPLKAGFIGLKNLAWIEPDMLDAAAAPGVRHVQIAITALQQIGIRKRLQAGRAGL